MITIHSIANSIQQALNFDIAENKKRIKAIRISIYLTGLTIILFFVYLNVFKTVEDSYLFDFNVENFSETITIPAKNRYTKIYASIALRNCYIEPNNFEMKTIKTVSLLTREKKSTITDISDLKKILFIDNQTPYPNGSILSYNKNLFFLEEGKLRVFSSKAIFEKLGLNSTKIVEINAETFRSLQQSNPINENDLFGKDAPQGAIIKSGEEFFITGSKSIHSIFSKSLIEEIWPNFSFIETNDISPNKMQNLQCYIISPSNIECDGKLEITDDPYDIHMIKTMGVPRDMIEKINITMTRSPNKESSVNELKKLLW